MSGGEACIRKGMERTRLRKPSLSQSESACPGDSALLAPATNSSPPERDHPIPEHSQTLEVSWYRVVAEVALHDRLEREIRLREQSARGGRLSIAASPFVK